MINRKQYIRLTIVLALPLLMVGWWLGEKEIIFPRHYFIICSDFTDEIICLGRPATKERTEDVFIYGEGLENSSHLIRWGESTILIGSSNEYPILSSGPTHIDYINNEWVEDTTKRNVIKTEITLPPEARYSYDNRCQIDQSEDDTWLYHCNDSMPQYIKFINHDTHAKFQKAQDKINEYRSTYESRALFSYIKSLLIPITTYFAVSIILFLLSLTFKYVIHGRENSDI